MLKKILSGVCAGIAVSIGGAVYLAVENKVVGAVLFSVALLCICLKGYSLFTGKVGYVPQDHSREALSVLFLGLLGNAIGTLLCGFLIRLGLPNLWTTAAAVCTAKLTQTWYGTLIRATFCGILMYLAVSVYREKNSLVGILFCIPTFILAGFEHSIADMFYFTAGVTFSWQVLLFILMVLLGNSLGAMILPVLSGAGKEKKA